MAARHAGRITVATEGDVAALEATFDTGLLDSAVVEIEDGATVLRSARELRRLADVARAAGVELTIASDDPLVRELARIAGLRLEAHDTLDRLPLESAARDPVKAAAPTRPIRSVAASDDMPAEASTMPRDRPTATLSSYRTRSTTDHGWDDSEASFSFVVTPPLTRAGVTRPVTAGAGTSDIPPIIGWADARAGRQVMRARRRRSPRQLLWCGVFGTLFVAGALVALLILPTATIAITPVTETIDAELTYGVALPGATYDVAIEPELVTTTLRFSATAPTTGERFVPDSAARGAILLTNASTSEVLVPAGTIVTSGAGRAYTTQADVTVPAADPFESLTFGSALADVIATQAGPDSNADPEVVSGQLDSGIFYSNRDPIAGGTNRRIATVSQADLDALATQATTALATPAASAVSSGLAPGLQLVGDTVHAGPILTHFDQPVGVDADRVSIDASSVASAWAFRPEQLHAVARDEILRRLRDRAGERSSIVEGTTVVSEPEPIAGPAGTSFRLRATAQTRARISEAELAALRDDLAGVHPDEASRRVREIDGVGAARIDVSRSWLTGALPHVASRITIEVDDGHGQTATS